MFGRQELKTLRLRKQALLLQSGLNRLTFQVEIARWREVGGLLGFINGRSGKLKVWALALAPMAGAMVGLGFRRSRKVLGSLATVIAVAKPLIRFWRASVAPSR